MSLWNLFSHNVEPEADEKPHFRRSTTEHNNVKPSSGGSNDQAVLPQASLDNKSKFEKLPSHLSLNGFRIGSKVIVDGCMGTVGWIGWRVKEQTRVKDYLVGVVLNSLPSSDSDLTDGLYEGERLIHSDKKNVMFTKMKNLSHADDIGKTSAVPVTKPQAENSIQTTADGHQIKTSHWPVSKFDEVITGDLMDVYVGVRVYVELDKRSWSGTVRWIGCYHNRACNTPIADFIVGVQLVKPKSVKFPEGLTDGMFDGEMLLQSSKKDVKYTKLKHCVPAKATVPETGHSTRDNKKSSVQTTANGLRIQTRYLSGSQFDDVVGDGIRGIAKDARVYLLSDIRRVGTVKWIGCYHNQVGDTHEEDFMVGVKLDNPEQEAAPEVLTAGWCDDERVVNSNRKDVKFVKLQYCSLVNTPVTDTRTASYDERTAQATASGLQIETLHSPGSKYDQVVGDGLAGLALDMRVYLHGDKSRSGTVKWIGCLHNRASETYESDFIVGVKLDKPEEETVPETLTNGYYEGEQLVRSTKKDIKFVKHQYCSLRAAPVKGTDKGTAEQIIQTTADGIRIDTLHSPGSKFDEVVTGDLSGIDRDVRVYLYPDKSRCGKVKWIGCFHNRACEIPKGDFIVGVKLDRPENELYPSNGYLEGEQLVQSSNKDIMFVKLRHCFLATTPIKETWNSEYTGQPAQTTASGLQIETLHSPGSKYDEVVGDGLAGLAKSMRVYLHGNKRRSGTVKWIGCLHNQACEAFELDFIVAVKLDNPDRETFPEQLTNGLHNGAQLVHSFKKDIKFVELGQCSILTDPATEANSGAPEHNDGMKTRARDARQISEEKKQSDQSAIARLMEKYEQLATELMTTKESVAALTEELRDAKQTADERANAQQDIIDQQVQELMTTKESVAALTQELRQANQGARDRETALRENVIQHASVMQQIKKKQGNMQRSLDAFEIYLRKPTDTDETGNQLNEGEEEQ